jgi:hypothetical protein
MSGIEVTIQLAVVAALASYLYRKHRQRRRSRLERYDPAKWTGKAIDVAPLKPRIESVRRNYLAAQQPAKGLCFHRALLELARRAVAQLAYFHDRASEHHAQAHTS